MPDASTSMSSYKPHLLMYLGSAAVGGMVLDKVKNNANFNTSSRYLMANFVAAPAVAYVGDMVLSPSIFSGYKTELMSTTFSTRAMGVFEGAALGALGSLLYGMVV